MKMQMGCGCCGSTCGGLWLPGADSDPRQLRLQPGDISLSKSPMAEIWKDGIAIPIDGKPGGALPLAGGPRSFGLGAGPDSLGIGFYNLNSNSLRFDRFLEWSNQSLEIFEVDDRTDFANFDDFSASMEHLRDREVDLGCRASGSGGDLETKIVNYGEVDSGRYFLDVEYDNVPLSFVGPWFYDTEIIFDTVTDGIVSGDPGFGVSVRLLYNSSVGYQEVRTDSIPYDGSFFASGPNYVPVGDAVAFPGGGFVYMDTGIENRLGGVPAKNRHRVSSQATAAMAMARASVHPGEDYGFGPSDSGRTVSEQIGFLPSLQFEGIRGGENPGAVLTTGGLFSHTIQPQSGIRRHQALNPTGFSGSGTLGIDFYNEMTFPYEGESHLGAGTLGGGGFTIDLTKLPQLTVTDDLNSCYYLVSTTLFGDARPRNTPMPLNGRVFTFGGSVTGNPTLTGLIDLPPHASVGNHNVPMSIATVTFRWEFASSTFSQGISTNPDEEKISINYTAGESSGEYLYRNDEGDQDDWPWRPTEDFEIPLSPDTSLNAGGKDTISSRKYVEVDGIRVQGAGENITIENVIATGTSTDSKVVRESM